ncbi:maleylpyruvate isomerase N-terminal domain-containing protein [Streptomyces deccanensis]|uniref:maleylpyruvate isomerase N-terminal domain-containing protein n=1 Tax=Streptomyces deccanensis TaxID=424188 RepID=UPI001EFB2F3F|nr:maleylpyruvate isomerase N-terminal domain-containing protein [Streptomyces deccanensis]ULR51523.1 maleylpyruvate isomerase N-terminal domain-containing protein [Streptomyces deccanensis]
MGTRADAPIAALRSGHDELASFVAGLTEADLNRRSGSHEWTVAQVLSHLGSGAEIGLAMLEAALTVSPAPGGGFNERVWDRWNAMTARQQADSFRKADEALVQRYEGLDEATRSGLTIDLGFLPAPLDVVGVTGLRLGEFTYHAWDVHVAFDPGANLAPQAVEHLFEPLDMLIGFLGRTEALDGRKLSLAVRTTAPERLLGLELGDSVSFSETPQHPDGELELPAEALLRLTVGRLDPEHTPAQVRLTSDRVTLDDLRRVFPGF